jgi:hypothetical protein
MFFPAHDPVMDDYGHGDRPIDVVFVGGYSRHHRARAKILERVAQFAEVHRIELRLDASRLTRLAESPFGKLLPLQKHRRPGAIARIARPPVFGRDLYELIGSSKIVLNGAIDMAGNDRGNMRCFEAMGCGALLVSDEGRYPDGMKPGTTIETYGTPEQAVEVVTSCLRSWPESAEMAALGRNCVRESYSKARQWKQFCELVGRI